MSTGRSPSRTLSVAALAAALVLLLVVAAARPARGDAYSISWSCAGKSSADTC
jgi:hypothetical protein